MSIENDFQALQSGQSNIEQDFQSLQDPNVPTAEIGLDQFKTQQEWDAIEQQKKAEETKAILGDPKDPNFDTTGLEPWEYKNGLVTGTKRRPGFLKTMELMLDGTHRGVSEFALGLLSMLPFGKKYQDAIKATDEKIEAKQQKNIKTYDSWAPQIGEFGGELLATAPAGGLLSKIGSKAMGLAKGEAILPSISSVALPTGTKLLGAYGTAGVGGAGVLSGIEALKYQGDQFDFGKAGDKFLEGMKEPLNYLLPAGATAVGRYLDKSRAYQKAIDEGIDVLPRDLMEKGPMKTLSHLALDSIALINPFGRRAEQLNNIGSSIGNIIKKISTQPTAMSTADLTQYATKNLQSGLKALDLKSDLLWNKGFKNAPVTNLEEITPLINEAKSILQDVGATNFRRTEKKIDWSLNSDQGLKFGDLKDVGSTLGKAASALLNPKNTDAVNSDAARDLFRLRKEILDKAAGNLSGADRLDYNAAKAFSANQFELQENIPLITDAITNEIKANKIITGILKDTSTFDKSKAMNIMSQKGQAAVKAAKIADALSKSNTVSGGVDLDKFIRNVKVFDNPELTAQKASSTKALLGDEYKHIEGLVKHLDAINEAKTIGQMGKTLLPLVGAGAIVGGSMIDKEKLPAIATYSAMLLAANHPALKKLLGATTRKLSDSVYKNLNNKIQSIFTRAGYFYNDDGSLSEGTK